MDNVELALLVGGVKKDTEIILERTEEMAKVQRNHEKRLQSLEINRRIFRAISTFVVSLFFWRKA